MMAVGDGDAIDFFVRDEAVKGKAGAAFAFGMDARVHEQAVSVNVEKPSAGADVGIGIKVDDFHCRSGGVRGRSSSSSSVWEKQFEQRTLDKNEDRKPGECVRVYKLLPLRL